MKEILDGFFVNNNQPSPEEVTSALSNKLDELPGIVAATGETGIEIPDFETILSRIRTALETTQNPEQACSI